MSATNTSEEDLEKLIMCYPSGTEGIESVVAAKLDVRPAVRQLPVEPVAAESAPYTEELTEPEEIE